MLAADPGRPTQAARARPLNSLGASRRGLGQVASAYLFLLPWFLGLFGLIVGPALVSLYLSFTRFDLISDPRWVGGANYARIFTQDSKFTASLGVTFYYVLFAVPLKLAFALTVAVMLNRGLRGLSFFRALFYLPSLMGGSVAIAILWRKVFAADGLFNAMLLNFGIEGRPWITDPDTALYTLVLLSIWQFGSPMIIFLAGLRNIPADLYEAANLDGASPRRQFLKITLPLMTPIIFFNLTVQTIDAFKAFTPAFIISDGSGGPVNATLFYTLYLFQEAFSYFRMGYASALAWVLVAIIAFFTALSFATSKFWVHYDD